MAERRLFVRLAAVGGDQTRRELLATGDSGRRMAKEIDAAALRLRAFGDAARRAAQIAGAALGAALAYATKQAADAAFEAERLSVAAGTTPQALQAQAAATRTVGVEMEKYADILKDTQDKIGDFLTTGGGGAADFFEQIAPKVGLTAEAFRSLAGPQALQLYFDGLEKANLSQSQTVFFLEALASDASLLIPLLRNGGAEMQRLAAQAEGLGVVIDRRGIAALQGMRTAVSEAQMVLTGFGNQLAVAIAPAVEGLARAFTAAAQQGGILRQAFDALKGSADTLLAVVAAFGVLLVGQVIKRVAAFALGIRGAITAVLLLRGAILRLPFVGLFVALSEALSWFGKLVEGAGGFGQAMALMGDTATEVWQRISLGAQAMSQLLDGSFQLLRAAWFDALATMQSGWVSFITAVNSAAEAAGLDEVFDSFFAQDAVNQLNAAAKAARDSAATSGFLAVAAFEKVSAPLEALNALQEAVAKSGKDAAAATGDAAAAAERLRGALGNGGAVPSGGGAAAQPAAGPAPATAGGLVQQTADTSRELAQAVTGPLKQALQQGELSWKAFGNAVVQIMQNVASRVLEAAFKPLEEGLQSLFSSLLGGASSGGSKKSSGGSILGQVVGALVGAVAGGFGGGGKLSSSMSKGFAKGGVFDAGREVTRFALGGIVDRPTNFTFDGGRQGQMGEAGKEAIMPLRTGPDGRLGVTAAAAPAPEVKIVNVLDPGIVGDYLGGAAGERLIMNVIRRNKRVLAGV